MQKHMPYMETTYTLLLACKHPQSLCVSSRGQQSLIFARENEGHACLGSPPQKHRRDT